MNTSARSLAGLALCVLAATGASRWWADHSDDALGAQVASAVRPGEIRMLSSDTCTICGAARAWFTEHRVPYSECSIERSAACKAEFDATGSPGTPVLVVRGQPLVGFNPLKLQAALGRG